MLLLLSTLPCRPRAPPEQAAPPGEPAVETERVPSPPRIADLRRKYGAKGGPSAFLSQPRPRSPSSSPRQVCKASPHSLELLSV